MKKAFPGYYRPTEGEFKKLWNTAVFVFDANVLLNLYRYSVSTRDTLLDLMAELGERSWLPHQAAYEYHKNRLIEISRQAKLYGARRNDLQQIVRLFEEVRAHPHIKAELVDELQCVVNKVCAELEMTEKSVSHLLEEDPVLERVTNIFEGKVTPKLVEPFEETKSKGEARYAKEIPPGYKDRKKEGSEKYGDYVVWRQIIDKAKQSGSPMILVQDDMKEDWWLEHAGKVVGPRPELVQELLDEAGQVFYMYTADRFMHYAPEMIAADVPAEAVKEVKESLSARAILRRAAALRRQREAFHAGFWAALDERRAGASEQMLEALRGMELSQPTSDQLVKALLGPELGQPTSDQWLEALGGTANEQTQGPPAGPRPAEKPDSEPQDDEDSAD